MSELITISSEDLAFMYEFVIVSRYVSAEEALDLFDSNKDKITSIFSETTCELLRKDLVEEEHQFYECTLMDVIKPQYPDFFNDCYNIALKKFNMPKNRLLHGIQRA